MSTGKILLGILLFALVTAVLYVWGLWKSMGQVIRFLADQQYIESAGGQSYRLKQ